jgi:lipoprotein-releasing system permease protein
LDYRLLIARRYLSSPRSVSLISKITGVSIAGVSLGVAALIVVLSVMNGFFDFVRDMLVSYQPHVRIVHASERGFTGVDSVLALARRHPAVRSAAPYIEGKALLLHEGRGEYNKVVIVRGVREDFAEYAEGVVTGTTFGRFDVSTAGGRPGIVLGRRLGERLLLTPPGPDEPGSRVALMSAPAIERSFTRVLGGTPFRQFEVRGLFRLESVFDESHVFISLDEADRLFRMDGAVSGVEIRLTDLERADEVRDWIAARLNDRHLTVLTWYDLQRSLYDVMRLEKFGASLILLLIVVVAAFNIVGSLTMIVIEKRRDVGALRAMGVSRRNVRRIFLSEGLLIGVLGGGTGVMLGLGLSWLQKTFEIVPLADAGSFLIDAYPVAIRFSDVALVGLAALALCTLAAVYPAMRASAIEPARAIHMDG